MKITNFTIIFVFIFICIAVQIDTRTAEIQAISSKKIQYDLSIESAVDDAVLSLVEVDSRRNLVLNKNTCILNFYQSLYLNFGILSDARMKEQLRLYIPVILVTDTDGYYIYYNTPYKSDGSYYIKQQWTTKKPYSYEDSQFIYSFTLDDYVKVYDKERHAMEQGKFDDLSALYSGKGLFTEYERFDEERRKAIIQAISEDMAYYINEHNKIAEHYGITYNFALPVIEQEDWYRTIDDISLFVVFQGYPYGAGTNEIYNRYAFAGARIKKSDLYYITDDEKGKVYHKGSCTLVPDQTYPYFNKKECALEGAYPCQKCSP